MSEHTSPASPSATKRPGRFGRIIIALFGILLPIITLGVEFFTHMCAETFFDPIPTIWHILLISFVPLANILVLLSLKKDDVSNLTRLGIVNGIAIGVSLFYTILFLPLSPLSVIGIIFYGMGLLPLSPLLALIASLICRRYINTSSMALQGRKGTGLWPGLAIALAILILSQMPLTFTRTGMRLAASNSSTTSSFGIKFLRVAGSKNVMLKMCYERPGFATDIIGFLFSMGDPVYPAEARQIYYRVTGKPFNTAPRPRLTGRGRFASWDDDFAWDEGLGGATVAGRVRGLSLASSRMDGSIDPDAALGYLEWTMSFHNTSGVQREARAQFLLPPDGVVSRLTLWVNGEEREAAFAAHGKVREAYSKVVSRRRDPVLVTTSGPDRVLVQCFPVPPDGEMKIRIGITFPLMLENEAEATLLLPLLLERNFDIPEQVRHSIWMEATRSITTSYKQLRVEHPEENVYAVRGEINDTDLSSLRVSIQARRSVEISGAWALDHIRNDETLIQQKIEKTETFSPSRVIIVIDGSYNMRDVIPTLAETFSKLPENIEFSVLLASDRVEEILPIQRGDAEVYQNAGKLLTKKKFAGGCDNIPVLERAWDLATTSPDGVIVWIHGVQALLLEPAEGLRQRWERRPQGGRLFDIQVSNGPNRVLEALDGIRNVVSVPFSGNVEADVQKLFSAWSAGLPQFTFVRENMKEEGFSNRARFKESSSHLVRIWAFRRILDLHNSETKAHSDEALRLAVAYQLVTPVSGAVVLETQAQYKEAGLTPVDPASVPTIPEPELLLLIAVALLVLAIAIIKH